MARIRSVHPGQANDEDFVEMSMEARLFSILLRCECDDQGVFEWKPKTLKMRIFPADNVDAEALLGELVANQQATSYEIDGRKYGAVRNFRKFQRPKKPNCIHPVTDEIRNYVGISDGEFPTSSPPVPHQFPTSSEIAPQMEDGGCNIPPPPSGVGPSDRGGI